MSPAAGAGGDDPGGGDSGGGDSGGHDPGGAARPVHRAEWLRPAVLVVLVVAGGILAVVFGLPDMEGLRAGIASAGVLAPVAFVVLYAVATLAPLPKNVLSTMGGFVFGLLPGIALVLLAAMLGAAAAFALGRLLGRDAVERLTGAGVARVDGLLRRRGVLAVVGVRLVPVLPFTAINYAAGLTAVRTRDYVVGTALGIVPGTVAFVTLGAYGSSPGSWPFTLAVILLVGLTAAGAAVAGRSRSRRRAASPTDAPTLEDPPAGSQASGPPGGP